MFGRLLRPSGHRALVALRAGGRGLKPRDDVFQVTGLGCHPFLLQSFSEMDCQFFISSTPIEQIEVLDIWTGKVGGMQGGALSKLQAGATTLDDRDVAAFRRGVHIKCCAQNSRIPRWNDDFS